jgi:hypothetical protein
MRKLITKLLRLRAIAVQRVVICQRPRRLERWAERDEVLMKEWWAAIDAHEYEKCERLRRLIRENWRQYREGS